MNLNVPSLDKFTYQAPLNPLPGVVYMGRKFKKVADIDTDKHKNKLARVDGVVDKHVNALVESFKGGIDTTLPPPVIDDEDNGVDLYHRARVFEQLNISEYAFDIYKFENEFAKVSFQLLMNDHKPAGASKKEDIINAAVKLIEDPKCQLSKKESVIKDWVNKVAKHKYPSTRGSIVKEICQKTKTKQAVFTYSKKELNSFYNNWLPNLTKGGMIDLAKDMYGYDVQTKYEATYAISAVKKLRESSTKDDKTGERKLDGKKSYFVLHTTSPEKNKDIPIMRRDMLNSLDNFEESLIYFVKWYNKHKCMPWEIKGFLPQIDGENEKRLITKDKI